MKIKLMILVLLPLFLIALFLRFHLLSDIPLSYYHDELDYVLNGEALARFGTDLSGQWQFQQLLPLHTLNVTAELPVIFHALVQQIFGLGVSSGHYPAAVFGVLTVGLLFVFIKILTGDKRLAMLSALVLALNPWHIYISRMGYEAVIAIFFQLAFICSLHQFLKHQDWRWSVPLLLSSFFAFYSYHGSKLTMLFIGAASVFFIWWQRRLRARFKFIASALLIICLGLLAVRTWQLQAQGLLGERSSELLFDRQFLTETVDLQRRTALSFFGLDFLSNKASVLAVELFKHYVSVFDLHRVFISGYEGGFQFSLAVHGFFYLSSLPLIVLGLVWWWRKQRQALYFILLFLLTAPLTSAVMISQQSIFRSGLSYLLLAPLIAAGAIVVYERLWRWRSRWLALGVFYLIFVLESLFFAHAYFARYPLVSAENHYFFERLLADYLRRSPAVTLAVVDEPVYSRARAIIAYNALLPELTLAQRAQFADSGRAAFELPGLLVSNDCPVLDERLFTQPQVVAAAKFAECDYHSYLATAAATLANEQGELPLSALSSPLDSGAYFYLLGDQLCTEWTLPSFIHTPDINSYRFADLTTQEFCQTWVKQEFLPLRR